MADYYCLVTQYGRNRIAQAVALGTKINLAHMALGDGGGAAYDPMDAAVELVNEVYRSEPHNVAVDPNNPSWIYCEMILPATVGGWTIREVGVFDDLGGLVAIGKYPESYKSVLADGTSTETAIRLVLETANVDVIQILVDPTVVMASQNYVNVQISNALTVVQGDIAVARDEMNASLEVVRESSTVAEQIPGGLTDQLLSKASDEDGNFEWIDQVNESTYFIGQF